MLLDEKLKEGRKEGRVDHFICEVPERHRRHDDNDSAVDLGYHRPRSRNISDVAWPLSNCENVDPNVTVSSSVGTHGCDKVSEFISPTVHCKAAAIRIEI